MFAGCCRRCSVVGQRQGRCCAARVGHCEQGWSTTDGLTPFHIRPSGLVEFDLALGFELAHGIDDPELGGFDVAQFDMTQKRHFLLHGFGGRGARCGEQQFA